MFKRSVQLLTALELLDANGSVPDLSARPENELRNALNYYRQKCDELLLQVMQSQPLEEKSISAFMASRSSVVNARTVGASALVYNTQRLEYLETRFNVERAVLARARERGESQDLQLSIKARMRELLREMRELQESSALLGSCFWGASIAPVIRQQDPVRRTDPRHDEVCQEGEPATLVRVW